MKFLRFFFIVILLNSSTFNAKCQIAISADVIGGTPLSGQTYLNAKGSPYLFDNFEKGVVTLASGRKFENIDLMYDQVTNQLIFKDRNGDSKIFNQPVVSFNIGQMPNVHQFERGIDGVFYEQLMTGKVMLWKRNHKSIIDEKPYGSATIQRNILNNVSYYGGELTQLVKLKTDKKSILTYLSNKTDELETFIKKEKLSTKNEADLIHLFEYYNSLY
ncbi:hypothetical protein [Emticicia sp. SJ17W-69]|uniref:hypothetical protein n=1 Tax=Emticicia sp. SJ17W-69 TaxID=3421657 RepID=UPI003EB86E4B